MLRRFLASSGQPIMPLELLYAVAPYYSVPDVFHGRQAIHFIDNTGALFGLAKGYSGDDDSARTIHAFHTVLAAIDCNVWLEYMYVQSGANISDLPSRGKFELLAEMSSISFPMVLLPVGGNWEAVYTSLFTRLAPPTAVGRGQAEPVRDSGRAVLPTSSRV